MKNTLGLTLVVAGMLFQWAPAAPLSAQTQQKPTVQIPQPGVPQIMTLEGNFVRVAYNNEGYVILGYEPANRSIGEQWMLLEIGLTVRSKVPSFTLTRNALSLETPDGKTIPLASVGEQRAANTAAVENRAKVQRDSINYFPPGASRACGIGFFPDRGSGVLPQDQVDVSDNRACLGRIFFHVPGGITYGQYWLNVKFPKSVVRVPFRILTKEEESFLSKNYKSIKQQVEEAFKKE